MHASCRRQWLGETHWYTGLGRHDAWLPSPAPKLSSLVSKSFTKY